MDVYLITDSGFERHPVDEVKRLLQLDDAVVWVDVPLCQTADAEWLADTFGFHDLAIHDCLERNHVSKIQPYEDHVFTVLHAPELGRRGHVHYIELDQFLATNYLVTVHGPLNPVVDPAVAYLDTKAVLRRLENGHLHPRSAIELSAAIVSAMTRREIDLVAQLARQSGELEQRVMLGRDEEDTEGFLEELFKVWYELLAIRTIAAHSTATYDRVARLARFLTEEQKTLAADLADRFEMVSTMAESQREFLHGVIEFFQTRTSTHMTIAADDLNATSVQQNDDMRKITAWVAIVAVPTAVTGYFGQNIPYPGYGERSGLYASLTLMIIIAVTLYLIFKRKRWL
jgi:Mg2+ and Co2+ transporter CorA